MLHFDVTNVTVLFIINVVNLHHIKFNYACVALPVPKLYKSLQQVLEELIVSRKDTIEDSDKTNKKVNNNNNNI